MPKPLTEDLIIGEILHGWTMPEYAEHKDRSPRWYMVMVTIGLVLVIYGMVTLNFLFSLIIILAGIILFLQSHQTPAEVPFAITELGVIVGTRFYPYTELNQFYIIYQPPEVKTLFVETQSRVRPTLRIALNDENPLEIRDTLRQFLTEDIDQAEEPLSETLARRWKLQ